MSLRFWRGIVINKFKDLEMKKLTDKEILLASKMLEIAADSFGNNCCNDVDEKIFEGWSTQERKDLTKQFHDYNGDPEEYDENHLNLPDFCIMGMLSSKLKLSIQ